MAALLASFLALFVLVSTVEAAICAPEASAHTSEAVTEAPTDPDAAGDPDSHAICSHGHCHHGGAATTQTPSSLTKTADQDIAPLRPADPLASRMPTGPDRPPRG
jgi:ABC-type nickel/cobalt efflux system permease component RcnA